MRTSVLLGDLHDPAVAAAKEQGKSLSDLLAEAIEVGLRSDPSKVFRERTPKPAPKASVTLTHAVRARARRFAVNGGSLQDIAIYGLEQILGHKNGAR